MAEDFLYEARIDSNKEIRLIKYKTSNQGRKYASINDLAQAVIGLMSQQNISYDKIKLSKEIKDHRDIGIYYEKIASYYSKKNDLERRKIEELVK